MIELIVEWAVIILTAAAIAYPAAWSMFFFKDQNGVGKPIAWMLIGEIVARVGGLFFFFATVFDWNIWQYTYFVASLRTIIILAGLITTVNLVRYLRKVQHHENGN